MDRDTRQRLVVWVPVALGALALVAVFRFAPTGAAVALVAARVAVAGRSGRVPALCGEAAL